MSDQSTSDKSKKLKHVRVYNQLYQLIRDGVYPPGSQLPSEPDLADQLLVSRMTLRRALALLQEDKLVKNIRGKGNFIQDLSSASSFHGMEMLQHPIYCCCTNTFERTELEFRIEPPTDPILQALEQKTAAVVIADRWYHCCQNVAAYTLSFLPIEDISEKQLNLNDHEEFKNYLESGVYEIAANSLCKVSYTTTGNFTAVKYVISQISAFILIQEILSNDNHKIILFNKHYIPVESFEMNLIARPAGCKS